MSTSITGSMPLPPGSGISTPAPAPPPPPPPPPQAIGSGIDEARAVRRDELSGDGQLGVTVQGCPCQLPGVEADTLKSLHIDLGWTFSGGTPEGNYGLSVAGQNFMGRLNGGTIRLDRELYSLFGDGALEIQLDKGPVYRAEISLCLPPVQTEAGVVRRLTNLGWYAGEGTAFDQRAGWAVRAYKRAVMNDHARGVNVAEDEHTDAAFLASLQAAYGAHPEDEVSADANLVVSEAAFFDCQLFGSLHLLRGSWEVVGAADDLDPGEGPGVWASRATTGVVMPIAGPYRLFLRAFDSDSGEPVMPNRINLPQPVLMAKFVLAELGYAAVHGPGGWSQVNGTWTRLGRRPSGRFDRSLQWAVREFQCYAKSPQAAREASGGAERRYLHRLAAESPQALGGVSRLGEGELVSGSLCAVTRQAMQAWADQRLRCPVVVYASPRRVDMLGPLYQMNPVQRENLWIHDEAVLGGADPFVYAIDWSGVFAIPAAFGGRVVDGVHSFPMPVVVGRYHDAVPGGPKTIRQDDTHWPGESNEVTPQNLTGTGGLTGIGMSDANLSTYKVVRTAAHFECSCFFDVINAYDTVGISLGLCHWTMARVQGGPVHVNEPRELPAFLACFQHQDPDGYRQAFGRYGVFPQGRWEDRALLPETRTYVDWVMLEGSTWRVNMAGAGGTDAERRLDNTYCKTWHFYWRALMVSRTSAALRQAMWTMVRVRLQDILDGTFVINGNVVRVGDVATSEKAVALLLRWHIYQPAELFKLVVVRGQPDPTSKLRTILRRVLAAHPVANQAREDALIEAVGDITYPLVPPPPPPLPDEWLDLNAIRDRDDVPQQTEFPDYVTNLISPTLSNALNSFEFLPP